MDWKFEVIQPTKIEREANKLKKEQELISDEVMMQMMMQTALATLVGKKK